MSASAPNIDLGNGDIGNLYKNYARAAFAVVTGGVSELVNSAEEKKTQLENMQKQSAPPTIEQAKANVEADPNAITKTRTYGRLGTIRNQGGMGGLASSVMNLSSPTLLGKV